MVFHSFPEITMVATPNLFSNPSFFLVRRLVAISVVTYGDSTRDARNSCLFNLMCKSLLVLVKCFLSLLLLCIFFLSLLMFVIVV